MSTPTLGHIHLFCNDLEKTVNFWVKGFEAKVTEYRKFGPCDGAVLDLGVPPCLYVKAIPCASFSSEPLLAGFDHIGMEVPDMQAALDRLLALPGVRLHKGPKQRESDSIAFVVGPDNILVELRAPKQQST
jgi:catechol 2,3-dioxygenase-like lactoylglutathione lyase family enzyme